MKSLPGRCGVVILAAGASTRMGRPKQLLPVGPTTLLEQTVDAALQSPGWPVVVVLGAHAASIRPVLARRPVLVAENPAWNEGMASSLRTGLGVLTAFSADLDAALFLLCDQPALDPTVLHRLITAWRETARGIVAARYNGHLGAPALFSRRFFPVLQTLTGDQGARQLLATAPSDEIEAIDLPDLARDLDTPADYERWKSS